MLAIGVPLGCMAALRAVSVLGGPPVPEVEVCLGFAAIATAVALAPSPWRFRVGAVVVVAAPAIAYPYATAFVLLHGHNLVGLVIWLVWTRQTVRLSHRLAVAAVIAFVVAAVLAGAFDALPQSATVAAFGPALAPWATPELAYRVVLAYVFLQSMHYVVWLRLIPSTQARSPAASTFRMSLAALRTDFGALGLAAIGLAALAVPVLACIFDPAEVRDVYLALALFHGWLELAMIGYLVASRGRLGEQ